MKRFKIFYIPEIVSRKINTVKDFNDVCCFIYRLNLIVNKHLNCLPTLDFCDNEFSRIDNLLKKYCGFDLSLEDKENQKRIFRKYYYNWSKLLKSAPIERMVKSYEGY